MDKKKLTLSVSADVIEKAKRIGLNLSDITESALRITSFSSKDDELVTQESLIKAYQKVFQTMVPILKKWNISIPIGDYIDYLKSTDSEGKEESIMDTFTYYLNHEGIVLWDDFIEPDEPFEAYDLDDKKLPIGKFFGPEQIINSLINRLYQVEQENKIKIQKLEVVNNLLKLSGLTKWDKENE